MKFNYYIPTRILFGKGMLNRLSRQELPGKKALLLISNGKSTKVNGSLGRVKEQLAEAGAVCFAESAEDIARFVLGEGVDM